MFIFVPRLIYRFITAGEQNAINENASDGKDALSPARYVGAEHAWGASAQRRLSHSVPDAGDDILSAPEEARKRLALPPVD